MTKESLKKAVEEAQRFIAKAQMSRVNADDIGSNKWNAAVKRASMDLTRALADLRAGR